MKTYSEIKQKEKFDWFKALSNPDITDEQWGEYKKLAVSWTTCACGNQCSVIPRNEDGQPLDEVLSDLGGGVGFYGAIKDRDAKAGILILDKIEKRSAELIAIEVENAKRILEEAKS